MTEVDLGLIARFLLEPAGPQDTALRVAYGELEPGSLRHYRQHRGTKLHPRRHGQECQAAPDIDPDHPAHPRVRWKERRKAGPGRSGQADHCNCRHLRRRGFRHERARRPRVQDPARRGRSRHQGAARFVCQRTIGGRSGQAERIPDRRSRHYRQGRLCPHRVDLEHRLVLSPNHRGAAQGQRERRARARHRSIPAPSSPNWGR